MIIFHETFFEDTHEVHLHENMLWDEIMGVIDFFTEHGFEVSDEWEMSTGYESYDIMFEITGDLTDSFRVLTKLTYG